MSGGHFEYNQYRIREITDEIKSLVANNDEWGCPKGKHYSEQTIGRFNQAIVLLTLAEEFVQRVDWLVSGDDGEDSFHARLETFLRELSEFDADCLVSLAAELYELGKDTQ